jgi:hypothetical protein
MEGIGVAMHPEHGTVRYEQRGEERDTYRSTSSTCEVLLRARKICNVQRFRGLTIASEINERPTRLAAAESDACYL